MKPHLTGKERRVLTLLREAGGLITHEELMTALYGGNYLVTDRLIVKTYIHRLRRKGYPITNVKGVGFILGANPPCPVCGREMPA